MKKTSSVFKVGQTVEKVAHYSEVKTTKNPLPNGAQLPMGLQGTVTAVKRDDIVVRFNGGLVWHVGKKEMKAVPTKAKFLAYGDGCKNFTRMFDSESELRAELDRVSKLDEWTGKLMGYKLVPILYAERKTVLTEVS